MVKRFKWSIKIVCLFMALTCLLFNRPLVDLHKRAVAENFNHGLIPYKLPAASPQPSIEGQISQVVVPKWELSLDASELRVSANIVNQSSNLLIQTDKSAPDTELAPGDRVYIFTANGHRFIYQFEKDIPKADAAEMGHISSSLMLQFYSDDPDSVLLFKLVEAQ